MSEENTALIRAAAHGVTLETRLTGDADLLVEGPPFRLEYFINGSRVSREDYLAALQTLQAMGVELANPDRKRPPPGFGGMPPSPPE